MSETPCVGWMVVFSAQIDLSILGSRSILSTFIELLAALVMQRQPISFINFTVSHLAIFGSIS